MGALITFILASLTAWAAPLPQPFDPFIRSFIRDSSGKVRMKDVADSKYEFKKLEYDDAKGTGIIGDCTAVLHSAPYTIHIDNVYWAKAGFVDRWKLMYHELAHCACGRDHTVESGTMWLLGLLEKMHVKVEHAHKLEDGCPDSLMNYAVPSTNCVVVHREYYIEELFLKCKKPIRFVDVSDVLARQSHPRPR